MPGVRRRLDRLAGDRAWRFRGASRPALLFPFQMQTQVSHQACPGATPYACQVCPCRRLSGSRPVLVSSRPCWCRAECRRLWGSSPRRGGGRAPWQASLLFSRVRLFSTPWTAARQASLSFPSAQSLLKLTSIESLMPSHHLILCRPLLLLPSIFASIRVFSNELALHIRWPKYWSFSFSVNPSNEYSGLISFRMDWLDLLAVQGPLKSLLQVLATPNALKQRRELSSLSSGGCSSRARWQTRLLTRPRLWACGGPRLPVSHPSPVCALASSSHEEYSQIQACPEDSM